MGQVSAEDCRPLRRPLEENRTSRPSRVCAAGKGRSFLSFGLHALSMNALLRTCTVLVLVLTGCGEKPAVVAEDAGAATNQPKTILDGKLGAAVAAVESSAKAPPPSSSAVA